MLFTRAAFHVTPLPHFPLLHFQLFRLTNLLTSWLLTALSAQ